MSKELEALDRLYKCNDDDYTLGYQQHDYNLLKQALNRLESIDNAEPSEALELVDKMANYILLDEEYGFIDEKEKQAIIKDIELIKQALRKVQEPKHYLKWEDLKFNIEKQMMTVLLNGTKYTLILGSNVHIDKLAFLKNGEINYYFLEDDKQFFNDLHLEVIEE